jgi:hypothetical protein
MISRKTKSSARREKEIAENVHLHARLSFLWIEKAISHATSE